MLPFPIAAGFRRAFNLCSVGVLVPYSNSHELSCASLGLTSPFNVALRPVLSDTAVRSATGGRCTSNSSTTLSFGVGDVHGCLRRRPRRPPACRTHRAREQLAEVPVNCVTYAPEEVNSSTTLLSGSDTYTLPCASTATAERFAKQAGHGSAARRSSTPSAAR